MYNKGLFAAWVPKPVMLLLIFLMMIPTLSISGVYIGNISDLTGALATYSEFLSVANNASAIGMGICLPIAMRIKMRFRSKEIITMSSLSLAALSLMCGTTDNPYVVIGCSFMIGVFKMLLMIEVILPLMFIIAPTGDRGRFYSVFYPISLCLSQLSSYFFANLIAETSYQAPFYIMSIVMLCMAVISLVFQHSQRGGFKYPLYQIDWATLLLIGAWAMCFNVFFTFMKQQGWLASEHLKWAFILGVVSLFIAIYRQNRAKRKLINFRLFHSKKNLLHSTVLLFFLGVFMSSGSIYLQYTAGVLGYNNLVNAKINLYMIPGIVIAGVMAFIGFKNKWNLKYYLAPGFIVFFVHLLSLYFMIQPQMDIAYLEYAMVVKGLAMGILFIGIWFYASVGLTMADMLGALCILLICRSFLITAIGNAIIAFASYLGQWQSLSDISMYLDLGDPQNNMGMFQNITVNALMASLKKVLGALCWLIVPVLTYISFHSYGKLNFRRVVLLRKAVKGKSIKGYKF